MSPGEDYRAALERLAYGRVQRATIRRLRGRRWPPVAGYALAWLLGVMSAVLLRVVA